MEERLDKVVRGYEQVIDNAVGFGVGKPSKTHTIICLN